MPQIAEGKYLKLVYNLHLEKGTLEFREINKACNSCDLRTKCEEEFGNRRDFNLYCLEGFINSEDLNFII